jgi:glycogen operon protein
MSEEIAALGGLNLAERIRRLAKGRTTLDVAQFQFIGLTEIRARYGDRWAEKRERVNAHAQHFISRRLAPDDVLFAGADGFLLVFGAFSGSFAEAATNRIAKELNAYFLGEPDLDYNSYVDPSETLLQEIIDDPILQAHNTRLIAEPWTAAGSGPGIGGFPLSSDDPAQGWGEWNAHFRDWWREMLNNDDWRLNSNQGVDGGGTLTGSESTYGWNDRKPYHAVNFITVHDGFTLYDLFSFEQKQNGCGLLNPICCDDPLSVWCDDESGESHNRSRNWGDETVKRQMARNAFVAIFISHGSPMILGGDEWLRTQFGNNNSYTIWSDNEWNWHRWGEWQSTYAWSRHRMHDFVRKLTRFRLARTYALSPSEYGGGMPFSWKNAGNGDMQPDQWASQRHIMQHYYAGPGFEDKPELLILINMERGQVDFTLPEGRNWARVLDTQAWFDRPGDIYEEGGYFDENPSLDPYLSANIMTDAPQPVEGLSYSVPANTIVILEQQR